MSVNSCTKTRVIHYVPALTQFAQPFLLTVLLLLEKLREQTTLTASHRCEKTKLKINASNHFEPNDRI